MLTDFGIILLFLIIGFLFVGVAIAAAALVRPHKPNPIKNATYECGEVAMGSPWVRFNSRFYVIALVFLIFDVEMFFTSPGVFKDLQVCNSSKVRIFLYFNTRFSI